MARIAKIHVVGPSTLEITWAQATRGGRTDVLDLTPLMGSYKVYRLLRGNADLFATAHLVGDGEVVGFDGQPGTFPRMWICPSSIARPTVATLARRTTRRPCGCSPVARCADRVASRQQSAVRAMVRS